MYQLKITDMTCGHCASVVTRTVKSLDPNAAIDINLGTHEVQISSECELNEITDALNEAGYPAQHIE